MKTNKELFAVSKLTLAVQGAMMVMLAMPLGAYAEDAEVAALTQPTNSVEVGVGATSKDSAKFGEYNGLDKKGANGIVNLKVRGGDAYMSHDGGDGINRWEITGTDLGTTSRELGGTYSKQGQWDFGFRYDELQHNISNTYQTPLLGSMGGNNFTLPANFGVINTSAVATVNGVVKGGAQIMTPTQLSAFHTEDVHSDRKNASFNAGYNIDQQWSVKFDYNHLVQSGAKLMSVATDAAKAASGPGTGGSTWGVEKMLMIMNPTNYKTDTFNLDLNWKGDKGYLTGGYYGSFFRDNYNGLTFPNFYAANTAAIPAMGDASVPFPINTLSTAPSNDFHQLNLKGGYTFTSDTRLTGGLSRGRNTQNEAYPFAMMQPTPTTQATNLLANPMGGGVPPQSSLNGLVVTTHADLKLTNQTTKDLMLSAGVKYNERDNQTASNTYNFIDLGGKTRTSVNTPMSNKKTQMELGGDYRINSSNRVRLAYEYEAIKRWCNNALANSAQGPAPLYPYTDASCAQVPSSKENKLAADYKLRATEAVNFNFGYSLAKRNSNVLNTFYNPMQALVEGYEFQGYRAFFQASRKEQIAKAGANWQASDKLSLGVSGRFVDDKYTDSTYGVQKGSAWSVNLDATYSYAENASVSAYLTQESKKRDLTNEQRAVASGTVAQNQTRLIVPTGSTWNNTLHDKDITVGLGAKQGGLMAGKFSLAEDLTYSLGKTGYDTQLNYAATTTLGWTCSSSGLLVCGSTPDIRSEMLSLKVRGIYQVDKASQVALGYMFQRLKSTDYYYNFYQNGYTSTGNLPTNEQSPSYSVNVVTASYLYNF